MIIYKIINKINNKVYVGQTIKTLKERMQQHRCPGNRCMAIGKAIQKYGRDNFIAEELCCCFDKEELDKQEQHFIEEFNSLVPNGYNLNSGGSTNKFVSEETKLKIKNTRKRREVTYLNLSTKEERTFPSILEASVFMDISQTTITNCCKGKWYSYKNGRWKYKEEPEYPDCKTKKQKQSRKIKYLDLSTNEIIIFDSIRDVTKLGFSRTAVVEVLKKYKKIYKNKLWCFINEDFSLVPNEKRSGVSKKIKGINEETGEEFIFSSLCEAQRKGYDRKTISLCCRNLKKTYRKIKWFYIEG